MLCALSLQPPPPPHRLGHPWPRRRRTVVADLFIDSLPLTVAMRRCHGVALEIYPSLCRPVGASEMTASVDRLAATTGQSVYTICCWTTAGGRSAILLTLVRFFSEPLYSAVSQLRFAASGQHGVDIDDFGHSEISSNVFVSNILYPYRFRLHTTAFLIWAVLYCIQFEENIVYRRT